MSIIEAVRFGGTGQLSHRVVDVDSSGTSITISSDKREIMIQNIGTRIVYWGGSGVTTTNGLQILPKQIIVFANCPEDFKIYFITASGQTSKIAIAER